MAEAPAHGLHLERPLTDAEMWRCVATTVLDVLVPALDPSQEWARAAAIQLVGLARYAADRPADPTDARVAELVVTLRSLVDNELVAAHWDGAEDVAAVMGATGAVLAAAVGRDDVAADQVRDVLRPIARRQLDDEFDVTGPLVGAFRGKLDG